MARKRPNASDVSQPAPTWLHRDSPAPDSAPVDGDHPPQEVVGIVIRARQLGFAPWRVAVALGISARGFARIEERVEHG